MISKINRVKIVDVRWEKRTEIKLHREESLRYRKGDFRERKRIAFFSKFAEDAIRKSRRRCKGDASGHSERMMYRVVTLFGDDKHDLIAADPRYPSRNFVEICKRTKILAPDPGVRTFK